MSQPNKRTVQRRDDGQYEVRKPGATRASAVADTQREGIDRAREILRNDGGGELAVRGHDGRSGNRTPFSPGTTLATGAVDCQDVDVLGQRSAETPGPGGQAFRNRAGHSQTPARSRA